MILQLHPRTWTQYIDVPKKKVYGYFAPERLTTFLQGLIYLGGNLDGSLFLGGGGGGIGLFCCLFFWGGGGGNRIVLLSFFWGGGGGGGVVLGLGGKFIGWGEGNFSITQQLSIACHLALRKARATGP